MRTNANGKVTFNFIPPGEYMLEYSGSFSDPFTPVPTDTINILP